MPGYGTGHDAAVIEALRQETMFGKALSFLSWAFFLVGVTGAIGTAAGWLPPYSAGAWAKITTVLLWLLFACEGYDRLSDAADETEEEVIQCSS